MRSRILAWYYLSENELCARWTGRFAEYLRVSGVDTYAVANKLEEIVFPCCALMSHYTRLLQHIICVTNVKLETGFWDLFTNIFTVLCTTTIAVIHLKFPM